MKNSQKVTSTFKMKRIPTYDGTMQELLTEFQGDVIFRIGKRKIILKDVMVTSYYLGNAGFPKIEVCSRKIENNLTGRKR